MATLKANTYDVGQAVKCAVVFTDPGTTTFLFAAALVGVRSLPVRSGILGSGFAQGAPVAVGPELATVGEGGGTTSAIPLAAPLTNAHPPGEPVALVIEPSAVLFKVKAPNGKITTYGPGAPVVRDQTGVYHVIVQANAAGTWYYRAEAGEVSVESAFRVLPSAF